MIQHHPVVKGETKNGQALLEIIVAVSIVTVVLVGLTSAISYAFSNVQFSRSRTLAAKYAEEAVEWLRNEKDILGWPAFYSQKATDGYRYYCLSTTTSWPNGSGTDLDCGSVPIAGTNFARKIQLDGNGASPPNNQDRVAVTVTMTWPHGALTGSYVINTYLTRWE